MRSRKDLRRVEWPKTIYIITNIWLAHHPSATQRPFNRINPRLGLMEKRSLYRAVQTNIGLERTGSRAAKNRLLALGGALSFHRDQFNEAFFLRACESR